MADVEGEIGVIHLKRRRRETDSNAAPVTPSTGSTASSSRIKLGGIRIADDAEDEKKAYRKRRQREERVEGVTTVEGSLGGQGGRGGFKPVGERGAGGHNSSKPSGEVPPPPPPPPRKRGGLRTAAEVAAEAEAEKQREREQYEAEERERLAQASRDGTGPGPGAGPDPSQETVYRDSSGRRINPHEEAALAKRAAEAEQRLARAKRDWNRGEVQAQEKRDAERTLEEMKRTGFSRYSNDAAMNDEQRDRMLWNDPAAGFLSKSVSRRQTDALSKRDAALVYPVYQGPPAPTNRFGIAPGYRWDGVDRGNGFEVRLFNARHARRLGQTAAYTASTDDM